MFFPCVAEDENIIEIWRLNRITVFDAEPIPSLDELVSKLNGARYFTKCDLTKGYWQIPLAEQSRAYMAFQTSKGLTEFNFMPFGLSTAACTFQKAMIDTLGELDHISMMFSSSATHGKNIYNISKRY